MPDKKGVKGGIVSVSQAVKVFSTVKVKTPISLILTFCGTLHGLLMGTFWHWRDRIRSIAAILKRRFICWQQASEGYILCFKQAAVEYFKLTQPDHVTKKEWSPIKVLKAFHLHVLSGLIP